MGKRILIVEDEEGLANMVTMRLEANGYEVISANDGQTGLDIAKEESPDLIILDLMLPVMDGYKVCGLLKADGRYKNIPIIIFSAKAQDDDIEMGEEVGADAYMTKPFKADVFLGKVKELLGEDNA